MSPRFMWTTKGAQARAERAGDLAEKAGAELFDRRFGREVARPLSDAERAEIDALLADAYEKWERWLLTRLATVPEAIERARSEGDTSKLARLAKTLLEEADL